MPVYKLQGLTKLLKFRCKFYLSFLEAKIKKGNVMNFMVCFFLKKRGVGYSREKVFFLALRIEIHFLHGPSCKGHRVIILVTKFKKQQYSQEVICYCSHIKPI